MKKLLLLPLLLLTACDHRHDSKPPTPHVDVPVERIDLKLPKKMAPYREALQHNFDRMIPIINRYYPNMGPTIRLFIKDSLVAPGPNAGACAHSWRGVGQIELHLFANRPEGCCGCWAPIDRKHWSGGFGWEWAHLYDCQTTGVCGDGAYASKEAEQLQNELYNLEWEGADPW